MIVFLMMGFLFINVQITLRWILRDGNFPFVNGFPFFVSAFWVNPEIRPDPMRSYFNMGGGVAPHSQPERAE